jgi:hypothetical protein
MNFKNRFILFIPLLALLFPSCKEEIIDYTPKEFIGENESRLRVVNTASFPGKLEYFINDQKLTGDTIAYGSSFPISEFLRVPSGPMNFKATAPALSSTVYTSALTFPAGKYNTLFLIDTLPNIDSYMVTDDQLIPPADSGKALIRLVHVSKGIGNLNMVNVTTTPGDTLSKNIPYKSHTAFMLVNAGSQRFQLYTSGTSVSIGSMFTTTLTPNRVYTFFARGRSNGGSTYGPTLQVITTR